MSTPRPHEHEGHAHQGAHPGHGHAHPFASFSVGLPDVVARDAFAAAALREREQARWPPFARVAILRAEAPGREAPLEFAPRRMAVQVDDGGGRILRNKIAELGVTVHTGKNTTAIVAGEGATHRMQFADGTSLDTDMIVFSAGIRPRDELAKASELGVGARGGIVVDNYCRTLDPDIYAIGECALWNGRIFGLVAPGYEMARVCANHLAVAVAPHAAPAATSPEFLGADMSTKLKLMGVDVASLGDAMGSTPGSRAYVFTDERKQVYKKIVVSDCGKYLLGGVMVGDAGEYGTLLQMMLNKMELPPDPEFLILPDSGGKKPGLGVDKLPDSAQICTCNNVSKGEIVKAVRFLVETDFVTATGTVRLVDFMPPCHGREPAQVCRVIRCLDGSVPMRSKALTMRPVSKLMATSKR